MLAFAAMLGVGYGGFVALAPAVIAARFGIANLGALLGVLYTAAGVGSALGPPVAGAVIDGAGYSPAIAASLAIGLASFITVMRVSTAAGMRDCPYAPSLPCPPSPSACRTRVRRAGLAALAALALAPTAARGADPVLPLAEVTPGMRCTGLSVVRGHGDLVVRRRDSRRDRPRGGARRIARGCSCARRARQSSPAAWARASRGRHPVRRSQRGRDLRDRGRVRQPGGARHADRGDPRRPAGTGERHASRAAPRPGRPPADRPAERVRALAAPPGLCSRGPPGAPVGR